MRERWHVLAVLTFARTAMGFQFQSAAAVSPFLLDEFHLSYAALGTLVGLYLFPGIAVALPGGLLSRRFGDKRIACFGLSAMVVGGALMGATENLLVLTAGRVISGTGAVLLNVLATKMVTDWFHGREIVTALGILVSSWPLGIAMALVVLPPLAGAISWQASMYAAAALAGAAFALVAWFYSAPADAAPPVPGRFRFDLTRRELGLATLAGLIWAFYNAGFIVLLAFGPEFLMAFGHDAAGASAITSIVSWAVIPALPAGAWLAGRIGRPDVTLIVCFSLAAFGIWSVAALGPSIALFAAIGLVFGPPGGLIMALPGEAAGVERRALMMGVYFTCHYAGMGILPALAGFARDLTGSAAAPMWFAGAMMMIAIAILAGYRAMQSRSPAAELDPVSSTPSRS